MAGSGTAKKNLPQMNTDEHGLKAKDLSALFRKITYAIQKTDSPKIDGHSEMRPPRSFFMFYGRPEAGHEWFIGVHRWLKMLFSSLLSNLPGAVGGVGI